MICELVVLLPEFTSVGRPGVRRVEYRDIWTSYSDPSQSIDWQFYQAVIAAAVVLCVPRAGVVIVSNSVVIDVGITRITQAVLIGVDLCRVEHTRAVVLRVRYAVAVGIVRGTGVF